jgi:hypothetical protein
MNENDITYNYKKLFFPHIKPDFKQRKEINSIYCYTICMANYDFQSHPDFKEYIQV